jgi:hypothetical protein
MKKNQTLTNFLKYFFVLLPTVYLLKLNIATLLISILPIFFFIYLLLKKKVEIYNLFELLPGIYFIFFLYLFAQGLILQIPVNFLFFRYLFFLIIFVYILEIKDLNIIFKFLLIPIILIICDISFIFMNGHNIFGYKSYLYITSFFDEEKILGTYLFKTYILLLILSLLIDKNKFINLIIFSFPLFFFLIMLCGQRSVLLNMLILGLFLLIYLILRYKFKIFLFIIIFFFCSIVASIYFSNKTQYSEYLNFRLISLGENMFSTQTTKHKLTLQIYNIEGFEKIYFDENIKKENIFKYNEIIIYGLKDKKNFSFSLKDLFNDTRLTNSNFYICIDVNNLKCENNTYSPSDIKVFLENIEKKNYRLNEFIFDIRSMDNFHFTIKDLAWYAHARIAYEIWKENPLFGVGIKKYRDLCYDSKYKNFQSFSKHFCPTHPHNYIFELLAEIGAFGFIIYLLIILSIIMSIFTLQVTKLNKFLIIILIIFYLQFWFSTGRFFSSNESFYFFYLISIFLLLIKKKNENNLQQKFFKL